MSGPITEAAFEVDERIYPLEAVQSAVYAFTDRAFVRLEPAGTGRLKVLITAKPENASGLGETLKGEFDNELIHQALRLRVSEANRKIREFIVTKALVSAQPSSETAAAAAAAPAAEACAECASGEPAAGGNAPARIDEALEKEIDRLLAEIESGDGAADPLGVAVPWEEKFGAKAGAAAKAKEKAAPKAAAKPKAKAAGKKGR